MLFLAVFCGFLAEYQLEHKIERDREKQFMQSLLKDLQKDTTSVNEAITSNNILLKGLDTVLAMMSRPGHDKLYEKNLFLYNVKYTYWYNSVEFSELTISQLKNSGGYRLIKNESVATGIAEYDQGLEACRNQFSELTQYFHIIENTQKDILNMSLAKNVYDWFKTDKMNMLRQMNELEPMVIEGDYILPKANEKLHRYYSDLLYYSQTMDNMNTIYAAQKQKTISLIHLIRDNYKIKN